MQCAKQTALLVLAITSFQTLANDFLDSYYLKIEECTAAEKIKPKLTAHLITLDEIKYISLIRNLRIEDCSKSEEMDYLNHAKESDKKITLSSYNNDDLSKLTEKELISIEEINRQLQDYNLEVDLLSIYETLKVDKK